LMNLEDFVNLSLERNGHSDGEWTEFRRLLQVPFLGRLMKPSAKDSRTARTIRAGVDSPEEAVASARAITLSPAIGPTLSVDVLLR
jgi:hypothetical protein